MHSDLTKEARNILFKLHQESRYPGYNLGKEDPRLKYLQFLNRFQSGELIVYIFIFIFDYNDVIALEAGRMIEERLRRLNSIDLIRLDSSIRDFLSKNYHYVGTSQDIAINNEFNNASTLALEALCDSHSSMRELARWFLTKKGCSKNYFQEVYRNHLHKNSYHIEAILGLGEVGEEKDAHLFLPLLSHPNTKLKKASFTAISNIKPILLKDFVINALENGTSWEIHIASKFIIKNFDHFPISDLWELYKTSINTTFKLRILFLLDDLIKFKWTLILFLLKASEEAFSDILTYVENRIVNFSLYPYYPPSNEEAAHINEAMKKSLLSEHAKACLTKMLLKK